MRRYVRQLIILSLGLFIVNSIVSIHPLSALENRTKTPIFELLEVENQSSPGKEIQIVVSIRNLEDLYAYEINLKYDTNLLQFKSVVSDVKGFSINPIVDGDLIKFASTKTGDSPGENGNVSLCTLTFITKGTGTAKIDLLNVEYVNSKLELSRNETIVSRNIKVGLNDFSDIAGHWAEMNIRRAALLGFIEGYPDGTFRPQRNVTRVEFVAMLARALEWSNGEFNQIKFADNEDIPGWAVSYVAAAVERGVIEGYNDNTFRANHSITRDEATKMVVVALNFIVQEGATPTFRDNAEIPGWAQPYVEAASTVGLVKGRGNNLFAPRDNITRAETVTLILSALD